MHIAVLLAGVADPKKLLPKPASGDWLDLPAENQVSYKLSPFDEAALEIALKLRDQAGTTRVTAIVTDGAHDLALMRTIAAHKPDLVHSLCPPPAQRGNPAWLARHAPRLLCATDVWPDLILVGREHGDVDDGMVAPYLAEAWQRPFVSHALQIRPDADQSWILMRSATQHDELIRLPVQSMVSISNDKSNRLRHPLMKNVALAKQRNFEQFVPDAADPPAAVTMVKATPPRAALRGQGRCNWIKGTVDDQARAVAAYLRAPHKQDHQYA